MNKTKKEAIQGLYEQAVADCKRQNRRWKSNDHTGTLQAYLVHDTYVVITNTEYIADPDIAAIYKVKAHQKKGRTGKLGTADFTNPNIMQKIVYHNWKYDHYYGVDPEYVTQPEIIQYGNTDRKVDKVYEETEKQYYFLIHIEEQEVAAAERAFKLHQLGI